MVEIDLKKLIAKAQLKMHEKREDDHRREQSLAARASLNQMVPTVCFDDYLFSFRELEQRGYTFIQDELDCLAMFGLLSRSDYDRGFNSVLENKTTQDSRRKSTQGKRMDHSLLQDSLITTNRVSAC